MERVKIFSVFHKDFPYKKNCSWITPIGVGGYEFCDNFCLSDSKLENISFLNQDYAELTAIYWVWKNMHDFDYIGFSHYRRYFYFLNDQYSHHAHLQGDENVESNLNFITSDNQRQSMLQILNFSDVILPHSIITLPQTNKLFQVSGYAKDHLQKVYTAKEMVENFHREFMFDVFKKYIYTHRTMWIPFFEWFHFAKRLFIRNMFVMKKNIFVDYCDNLFHFCKYVHDYYENTFPKQHDRYIGKIAELFLSFYFFVHRHRFFEVPVFNLENDC